MSLLGCPLFNTGKALREGWGPFRPENWNDVIIVVEWKGQRGGVVVSKVPRERAHPGGGGGVYMHL